MGELLLRISDCKRSVFPFEAADVEMGAKRLQRGCCFRLCSPQTGPLQLLLSAGPDDSRKNLQTPRLPVRPNLKAFC